MIFKSDLKKYKQYSDRSVIILLLTQQGLWAIFVYRFSHAIYKSKMPSIIKRILLVFCVIWQKWIEIITGISISYAAHIGESFYIGHFGGVIIKAKAVIGNNCYIVHGVTIGESGFKENRDVPVLGNNVYIGANAVIAGSINVGDNAVIGANSFVNRDVATNTTVLGVPAVKISSINSQYYI